LVLVNIKFKLDVNMPVTVTNPGIGFGTRQQEPRFKSLGGNFTHIYT